MDPKRYEGQTFGPGDVVVLDGASFVRCRFEDGCTLVFRGTAELQEITDCWRGDNVDFVLEGSACYTLSFLNNLWENGPKHVVARCIDIITKGYPIPDGGRFVN
jgi:hypothetical protein